MKAPSSCLLVLVLSLRFESILTFVSKYETLLKLCKIQNIAYLTIVTRNEVDAFIAENEFENSGIFLQFVTPEELDIGTIQNSTHLQSGVAILDDQDFVQILKSIGIILYKSRIKK